MVTKLAKASFVVFASVGVYCRVRPRRYPPSLVYLDCLAGDVDFVAAERDTTIELDHSAGTFRVKTQ